MFQSNSLDLAIVDDNLNVTIDTLSELSEHPGKETSHFLNMLREDDMRFQGIKFNPKIGMRRS